MVIDLEYIFVREFAGLEGLSRTELLFCMCVCVGGDGQADTQVPQCICGDHRTNFGNGSAFSSC